MLQELINTYEELKKYNYIIDMGKKGYIILKFKDENFYHLVGLHKVNLDVYFPKGYILKGKKYKYMKSHIDKFENVIKNKMVENKLLSLRIKTFKYIPKLFYGNNPILYSLAEKSNPMSLYKGDFGLMKIYLDEKSQNQLYCLLGMVNDGLRGTTYNCIPQSWMADIRPSNLVQYKKPLYIKDIAKLPAIETESATELSSQ